MRVTIDLMKKSTQIIDLSNVINPRVGDDDLLLPLHIVYDDNQTDMRGKDVEFLSNDTNKKRIYVAGTCNTNTPGDNLYMGNLTFRFPAGTFKADGTYDPDKTMFRIVDKETQKVISSVNVKITVMKNNIEFDFDPDKTSYNSRLENMLHDFHDKGQAMLDEIKNLSNQAKSNVSGDTATTANEAKKQADQNAGDINDMQGEIAGARGRFANMADREDAQDAAINRKENIANANANYAALKQKDAQQDAVLAQKAGKFELEDKLAQMNLQPEMYADLNAVNAAYPNGTTKFVATDDGYLALYRNGQWIKGPVFQAAGTPDGSIDRTKLSDTYASPYDFLYGIKVNLDQLFKEGNYILSKDSNGDIPRGLPLDANLDKYIYLLENRVAGHDGALYVHQRLVRSDGPSYERFLSFDGKFNTDWNYVQENGLFIKAVAKEGLREIHLDLTDYELYSQNGETSSFKSQQDSDPGYPQMAVYKTAQKFPVSAGDKYVIYGYTDSTMLYALTDTSGKVYTSISGKKELYHWRFTVSQDGYLLVNSLYGQTRLWKTDGTQAIEGERLIEQSVKMPALQSSIQNSFYMQTEEVKAQKNENSVYKADGSLAGSSATSSIGKVHVASGESYRITSSEVNGIAILLFDGNNNLTRSFGAKDIVIPSENEWSIAVNGNNAKIEHIVGYLPKTLIGQNWCALGDSLTSKYTLGEGVPNYVQLVAERTGVTYYQQGHGGGGYLADSNAFLSLFPKNNSDIVTIFGSFNDVYVKDFKEGEAGTTDTNTLWGAVKKVIDNCYSVNPDIRIGLIAPTPWISVNPQQTGTNDGIAEAFNHQGAKAGEDYVQALKEISDYYSIPFLDLYHNSGLRVYDQDWDNAHTRINELGKGDGGHLNTRGSKIVANKMIKFIESL